MYETLLSPIYDVGPRNQLGGALIGAGEEVERINRLHHRPCCRKDLLKRSTVASPLQILHSSSPLAAINGRVHPAAAW